MRASNWPLSRVQATLDIASNTVALKAYSTDIERRIKTLDDMIRSINEEIASQNPIFIGQIEQLVGERISNVSQASRQFAERMRKLGIDVTKRADAVEPVDIEVKKELRWIREPIQHPTSPNEPYLAPDAVRQIVGLIDAAGKTFQVAPSIYSQLGEEDLRTIIVGQLNAVFNSNSVTGETFSKEGKTDIFVNVVGGAVLIGECKFWGGGGLYRDTINQLFRYMAWHHTIGIMITFSKRKGLTKVISEADSAIAGHLTYKQNSLNEENSTYRTSVHVHPDDPDKIIEIYHLFFNLYSGTAKAFSARSSEDLSETSS